MKLSHISALSVSLLLTGPLVSQAQLSDTVWTGASGGNWSTAGNWSAGDPTDGSRAMLNGGSGGSSPVTLDTTDTIGGLQIASGFTLQRSASDTGLRVLTIQATTPADGYFSNAGTISSSGASNTLEVRIHASSGTIANSGTIEATAGSQLLLRSASNATLTLDNAGGTLRTVGNGTLNLSTASSGAINFSGGQIQNTAGTIVQSKRSVFTNVSITNGGTYQVEMPDNTGNPWGLSLEGTSSFTNSGTVQIVRNLSASTTNNQGNSLSLSDSATFSNSATGSVYLSTIGTPSSGSGSAQMQFNATTTVTNNGTITLESRSTTNEVRVYVGNNAGVTLSGTGQLVLAVGTGGSVNRVAVIGGTNSSLTNAAGHTIRGAGLLGNNYLSDLTNAGTIRADDADNDLTVQLRTGGSFTNSGTVQVDAGSAVIVQSDTFSSTGTLLVNGDFTSTPDIQLTDGTMTGAGTITGQVEVSGAIEIAPQTLSGNSLTVDGNLNVAASGSLRTMTMVYDDSDSVLNVTGNLTVGANNAFEFTFQPGAGYAANTIYTLFNVTGTNTMDLSLFGLSAASIADGYALDTAFGTNSGWNLNGSDIEVRFLAVPESSTVGLMAIGVAFWLWRGRRKTPASLRNS